MKQNTINMVSVPLRGYGFEMLTKIMVIRELDVSVPLRGYGFEMSDKFEDKAAKQEGFRPLAGIWF